MDTEWRSSSGSVCGRDTANDRSDIVSVVGCGLSRLVRQCREPLPIKLNPMAGNPGVSSNVIRDCRFFKPARMKGR